MKCFLETSFLGASLFDWLCRFTCMQR